MACKTVSQHLRHQQPQLAIAHHSHLVTRSQHLHSACSATCLDWQGHLQSPRDISCKRRMAGLQWLARQRATDRSAGVPHGKLPMMPEPITPAALQRGRLLRGALQSRRPDQAPRQGPGADWPPAASGTPPSCPAQWRKPVM